MKKEDNKIVITAEASTAEKPKENMIQTEEEAQQEFTDVQNKAFFEDEEDGEVIEVNFD